MSFHDDLNRVSLGYYTLSLTRVVALAILVAATPCVENSLMASMGTFLRVMLLTIESLLFVGRSGGGAGMGATGFL